MHTAEWRVLAQAKSHAIADKIAAVTSAWLTRKAHALLLSAQRYAVRFAHILKTLPKAQRMTAINALREEQTLETQNIEKEEEAKLAEEKQRALAPIVRQHKEHAAALRRRQRDERIILLMRLRRTPLQFFAGRDQQASQQLQLPLRLPVELRYRARSFLGQKRAPPPKPRGPGLR